MATEVPKTLLPCHPVMWLVNLLAYAAVAALFLIVGFVGFIVGFVLTGGPWGGLAVGLVAGGIAAAVPFVVAGAADDVLDKLFPRR